MNMQDELTQKQALKFQLNHFNTEFIEQTLLDNKEGIFNLDSEIEKQSKRILNYLQINYSDYNFQQGTDKLNSRIYFRRNQYENKSL